MGRGWGGVDLRPRSGGGEPPPPQPSPIKGEELAGALAESLAARLAELEAAGLVRRA